MCNEFVTMPGTFSFGRKNKGRQKGTMQVRFLLRTFVEGIVAGINSENLISAFSEVSFLVVYYITCFSFKLHIYNIYSNLG